MLSAIVVSPSLILAGPSFDVSSLTLAAQKIILGAAFPIFVAWFLNNSISLDEPHQFLVGLFQISVCKLLFLDQLQILGKWIQVLVG